MKNLLVILFVSVTISSQAQNIGIGTTTPAFKLDVFNGSINTDSLYRINAFTVLSVKGNGNLFSGKSAGLNNISGYANSFVGDSAGIANITGIRNSFFGYNSGLNNVSGIQNTGVGARTLYRNLDGFSNTAIGYESLFSNTTGITNTAVGQSSMSLNVGGSYNTAIGMSSLSKSVSGMNNTAVGVYSLADLTNGANNAALGYGALYKTTTGESNAAIGLNALGENITGSYNAGLGYNAEVGGGNLTNATAIGARSMVSASNSLVLGSINGVNGSIAGTNIGIGLTAPLYKLDVMSASAAVSRFTGPDNMFLMFYENSDYRGYLGSYAGNVADVDLGTGTGNAAGQVHLTIQAVPKLTVMANGNVDVAGEINRSVTTGQANLLPISYGTVDADGTVLSGTGNFTVSIISAGYYSITIAGENYQLAQYTTTVNAVSSTPMVMTTSSGGGNLYIRGFDLAGTSAATRFTFVIYQQ